MDSGHDPRSEGTPTEVVGPPVGATTAAELELEVGTHVGRYIVQRSLGAGGMGLVYLADDPELDRNVAIKILRPGGTSIDDPERARRRLQREAQAIARLTHPNVVAVYDVGPYREGVFVAMEYVQGQSLRDWLRSRSRGLDEVLDVFLDAGRGLAAAHAAGIVHRDVKPDNVIVDAKGRAKVLDFGLARAVGEGVGASLDASAEVQISDDGGAALLHTPMTEAGQVMGTPSYMAPEQRRGFTSPATDQYAFCITLYESIYRKRPFPGRNAKQWLAVRQAGPTFPPSPRLPRAVRRVLQRGMQADPRRRYASMEELLRALRRHRSRRLRTVGWVAAASVASAAASFGWATAMVDEGDPCAQTGELDTWNDEARTRIAGALELTGTRLAADTWPGLRAQLDAWSQRWTAARRDACEATMVRGDQTGAIMDQRISCLERQRQAFDALVATLQAADTGVVAKAHAAAARLPSVDTCTDPVALALEPPRPADAPTRRGADEVRRHLADATALRHAGRFDAAQVALDAAAQRLVDLDDAPVRAEYELELAGLLTARDDPRAAEEALRRALREAETARYPALRLAALIDLGNVLGRDQKRFAAGEEVLAIAEAVALGLGDPPTLRARRRFAQAELLLERDRQTEARPIYLELLDGDLREIGRDVVLTRLARCVPHEPEAAVVSYREALALAETRFGPHHPRVADALLGLGRTLVNLGRLADSERALSRALDIRTEVYGPRSVAVAAVHSSLGVVEIKREQYEAAARELELAVELYEEDPHSVEFDGATVLSNLGIVYSRRGEQARARAVHERALAMLERTDPEHPRRVIPIINIASTYEREGRDRDAADWYERAAEILEQRPSDRSRAADLHVQVAEAHHRLDDGVGARRHFDRALQLYAADPRGDVAGQVETRARMAELGLIDGEG